MPMSGQGGARRAPAAAGRGAPRGAGDNIPCAQCPNPRECMAAGKCMLKEGQGMKRGGKVMAKKAGAKKAGSAYGAGMKRGGKVAAKKPAAKKTTARKPATRKR